MIAARIEADAPEISIEEIALADANGDPRVATELLTERILASPEIVQAHLPEWARAWAYNKVLEVLAGRRKSIIRAVNGGTPSFAGALAGAMTREFQRMMDMPLYGGKRLADATPEEVRESAARYQQVADTNAHMARWQRMVADAAEGKGATIGETLSEDTLTRLWSEANV